jgi:hypothetical protein
MPGKGFRASWPKPNTSPIHPVIFTTTAEQQQVLATGEQPSQMCDAQGAWRASPQSAASPPARCKRMAERPPPPRCRCRPGSAQRPGHVSGAHMRRCRWWCSPAGAQCWSGQWWRSGGVSHRRWSPSGRRCRCVSNIRSFQFEFDAVCMQVMHMFRHCRLLQRHVVTAAHHSILHV